MPSTKSSIKGSHFLEGFKQIFLNRSAIASLIGVVTAIASSIAFNFYAASFFRQKLLLSTDLVASLSSGLALCLIVGIMSGGRLVNRFGRKKMTAIGTVIMGLFTFLFFSQSLLWLSIIVAVIGFISAGVRWTASESLVLEQVPEYRGTVMSMNTLADALGAIIGNAIGGVLLLLYNWEIFGLVLGIFGVVSSLIVQFLVLDPTEK